MERCLSEIFGLETIGYKSITKLQSRQTGQAGLRFNQLLHGHPTGCLEKEVEKIILYFAFINFNN